MYRFGGTRTRVRARTHAHTRVLINVPLSPLRTPTPHPIATAPHQTASTAGPVYVGIGKIWQLYI